ncbi:hypothetical protein CYL18_12580 [Pradoshia eiseniae]|uniref:Lipoprotein n=1 Tax=Pradoshia eiseniae TaxID=2064768 RepID=A0A2S7MYG6_9BACI|nr:DUF6612 family protein [Pradoshia eiseniae]PQD94795.1 hypothetical protein CYL18_12580 [Pradoshia eiseniae]
MKRIFSALSVSILSLVLLVACSETAEPVSEQENKQANKNSDKSELTIKEVYEKMMDASEDIDSFVMDMEMEQEIIEGDNEPVPTQSTIHSKVVQEPIGLEQKVNMTIDGQTIETEQYFTEEGFYMYDPGQDMWMKYSEGHEDLMAQLQADSGLNQTQTLSELQSFIEDFTFEQNNEEFILTLDADDEKFNSLVQQELSSGAVEMNEVKDLEINGIEYEIFVDKKTYLPSQMNIIMNINMTSEGQKVTLKQEIDTTYSDYNSLDAISVPKEALENAVELEM